MAGAMDESDATLARIHEGTPVADFRRGGERGTRWEYAVIR